MPRLPWEYVAGFWGLGPRGGVGLRFEFSVFSMAQGRRFAGHALYRPKRRDRAEDLGYSAANALGLEGRDWESRPVGYRSIR